MFDKCLNGEISQELYQEKIFCSIPVLSVAYLLFRIVTDSARDIS